jgi:hypothetical protein
MASKVIQGRVTHVQQTTETQGQITRGTGLITSANAWSFRIANQAILFKSRGGASLSEGDLVVAAGQNSKGTFQAYAIRNDTTGSVHEGPSTLCFILGGLLAILGVPLIFFLVGLLFVPIGLYIVWIGTKMRWANLAVAATPIQQAG